MSEPVRKSQLKIDESFCLKHVDNLQEPRSEKGAIDRWDGVEITHEWKDEKSVVKKQVQIVSVANFIASSQYENFGSPQQRAELLKYKVEFREGRKRFLEKNGLSFAPFFENFVKGREIAYRVPGPTLMGASLRCIAWYKPEEKLIERKKDFSSNKGGNPCEVMESSIRAFIKANPKWSFEDLLEFNDAFDSNFYDHELCVTTWRGKDVFFYPDSVFPTPYAAEALGKPLSKKK